MAQNDLLNSSSRSMFSTAVDADTVINPTRVSTSTVYAVFGLTVRDWHEVDNTGKVVATYHNCESLSLIPIHAPVVSRVFDLLAANEVDAAARLLVSCDPDGNPVEAGRTETSYLSGVAAKFDKFQTDLGDGHSNLDVELNQNLAKMVSGKVGLTQFAWVRSWLKKYGLFAINIRPQFITAKAGEKHGHTLYFVNSLEKLTERPLTTEEEPTFSKDKMQLAPTAQPAAKPRTRRSN